MTLTETLDEKREQEGGMDQDPQVRHLSMEVLVCVAREHPEWLHYGYELFRRAIVVRSDEAWSYLYQLYSPQVLTWLWKSRGGKRLLNEGAGSILVNAAFTKLFQSIPPGKFNQFQSLGHILQYLRWCCQGAVGDEFRSRQTQDRFAAMPLEAMSRELEPEVPDAADEALEELAVHGLWQAIAGVLPCRKDRLLLLLIFGFGLKADEIHCFYPHLFATSREVTLRKRAILTRLRRNLPLKEAIQTQWHGGEEERWGKRTS